MEWEMKALTLWQPYASLVAIGAKTIETRSWATKYRGELAIHAGKCQLNDIMGLEPFFSALKPFGTASGDMVLDRGVVVATCRLADCVRIVRQCRNNRTGRIWAEVENGQEIDELEYKFGDYREGRFAWILEDVVRLVDPIPAKGRQGLWTWMPS